MPWKSDIWLINYKQLIFHHASKESMNNVPVIMSDFSEQFVPYGIATVDLQNKKYVILCYSFPIQMLVILTRHLRFHIRI